MFGVILDFFTGSRSLVWTLVVVVVVYYLWNRYRRLKSLPPGPTPLPLLGNIISLASGDQLETFRQLRKKYGDLVTLHVGSFTIVLVSGYDTLRELFVKRGDVTSDRPDLFAFREISKGEGIIGRSGAEWKKQRMFALGGLRDFGFGKKSLEGKIMEEVEIFLKILGEKEKLPIDPEYHIQISVANIICAILFGDPVSGRKVLNNADKIIKFLYSIIDCHKKDYDEENLKDFIDVYLNKINQEGQNSTFTLSELMHILTDIFVAAVETTTTALSWAILFFINNPDVQKRCHEEVMRVVGEGRFPSLSDRPQMPYIEATITEILRCGNITPLFSYLQLSLS